MPTTDCDTASWLWLDRGAQCHRRDARAYLYGIRPPFSFSRARLTEAATRGRVIADPHWVSAIPSRWNWDSRQFVIGTNPEDTADGEDTAGRSVQLVLNWHFPVVGTGVDPVTSRFSGARSTN
jgi:hypothetical protein